MFHRAFFGIRRAQSGPTRCVITTIGAPLLISIQLGIPPKKEEKRALFFFLLLLAHIYAHVFIGMGSAPAGRSVGWMVVDVCVGMIDPPLRLKRWSGYKVRSV